ncbi:MAG: CPBP family intramembrane metalloprotease [Chloroflexi bacterium]|nr:MAG: CPBP family intramembrane metalloprotease [Chloroflexota bacterium]
MKSKILAFVEILLVYAVIQITGILRRSTEIVEWEIRTLGWSYTGMFIFVGIPALVIWLTRRDWAEYGVSRSNWRTNLDLGVKAYLVRFIPMGLGIGGAAFLGWGYKELAGGALVASTEIVAIALMIWILNRQKPVASGRGSLITTCLLLLFPIVVALAINKLSLIIVSTVVWQFVFSGFGEEFVWRGYVQSRLNQAFGRPMRMFGIQFGWGLIIASLLFGLLHAFNTYDPNVGFSSLSWGWGLFTTFGGLLFGLIREKTGTLLAPGIAHGLPDAVGEALVKVFGWM